jgi:hypothetical protein
MIRLGRCIPHDRTGTMPMSKMCVAVTSHRINKSMNLLLYSVKTIKVFHIAHLAEFLSFHANHSIHRIKRS